MKQVKDYIEFINERKDHIGSRIKFEDRDGKLASGKIIDRKDNGDCLIACLSGRNKGNTKVLSPDDILESSAEKGKKKKKNLS